MATKKNWGQNILDSLVGLLVGVIIFIAAFFVLWNNEGAVDFSQAARTSVPVAAGALNSEANGKLVSLSGKMSTADLVGDPQFLKPGSYLQLSRQVEMYAWQEKSRSQTRDKLGGGSETTITYTYVKDWTVNPKDSSRFNQPDQHVNPPLPIDSMSFTAVSGKIGVYTIDPQNMELPKPVSLKLTPEMLLPGESLTGNMLYSGRGTPAAPQVGDLRITYAAVPNGLKVTAFGKLEEDALVPYLHQGKKKLYRAVKGTRAEALLLLAEERTTAVWTVRIIGFLLLWGGLFLILNPLNAMLKVLPWLGVAGRWMIGLITLPVALALAVVTVIVAIVAHNIWLLLALLFALGGLIYWRGR
ncbi:MAG: TMEM43 family protein [Candidatus Margulisbacteria bacterium]|nr:TMEM43 family protein [Candidatus Margulisiibacteriota bacterium]